MSNTSTKENQVIVDDKSIFPAEVQAAKQKGQRIVRLTSNEYTFYFRTPDPLEIKMLFDELSGDKKKMGTRMDTLIRNCLIHPNIDTYEILLQEKPGLFISLFTSLQETWGLNEDFLLKKL